MSLTGRNWHRLLRKVARGSSSLFSRLFCINQLQSVIDASKVVLIYGEFQAGVQRFFLRKMQVLNFQHYRILKKSIIFFNYRNKGGLYCKCLIVKAKHAFAPILAIYRCMLLMISIWTKYQ